MSGAPNLEPLVGQVYREIVLVQNLIKTIEGKIDAVETRVAQLDKLMLKNIDQNIGDMTSAVETRIDQLEQLMLRGQQGVVAQVTAEIHHMHAQLEAKLNRQTRLMRDSFALVIGIIFGIQWSIWMEMGVKSTCSLNGNDGMRFAEDIKAFWNYTQPIDPCDWMYWFY